MSDHSFLSGTRTGTVGGTLLVILSSIQISDIADTAILAMAGAIVSFLATLLMKMIFKKKR